MINPVTEAQAHATELLFYLSAALKNGVDAHFLAPEHAAAVFKTTLRDLGLEITKKEISK